MDKNVMVRKYRGWDFSEATHIDIWTTAWETSAKYERDRLSQLAESSAALDKHDGIPMLTSFEIRRGSL